MMGPIDPHLSQWAAVTFQRGLSLSYNSSEQEMVQITTSVAKTT